MDIKKMEDLEFEIFVMKQRIKETKNEEDKEDLKRELRKIQRKYNKVMGGQNE